MLRHTIWTPVLWISGGLVDEIPDAAESGSAFSVTFVRSRDVDRLYEERRASTVCLLLSMPPMAGHANILVKTRQTYAELQQLNSTSIDGLAIRVRHGESQHVQINAFY